MGRHALFAVLAVAAAVATALTGHHFGDYEFEAGPSLLALAHGQLSGFAHASVAYAGSMTLRAPVVALAGALGADPMWLYRIGSVPCLLAGAALAIHVFRHGNRWIAGGLVVTAPVWLGLMYAGHPEEILVTALVIGAILLAPERPAAAGVLLGLALAGKAWALIAVGPVLIAAGRPDRRLLGAALLAGAAAYAPFLAGGAGHLLALTRTSAHTAGLWLPWQLYWPLADVHTVPAPDGLGGTLHMTKVVPPALLAAAAHPLIVVLAGALSALAWRLGRRGALEALALFAFLAFLRCLLDPWNTGYYLLPCVVALAAWHGLRRPGPPVAALAVLALTWLSFHPMTQLPSRDAIWLFYMAWTLPAAFLLGREALLAGAQVRLPRADAMGVGRFAEKPLLAAFAVVTACATALTAARVGDYASEAAPSLNALAAGDVGGFTHASAAYAGSMTLRIPFVSLAGLLGAGELEIYRIGALPCLLALAALALVLAQLAARLGRSPLERWAAVGLIVLTPVWLQIMSMGHPEEALVTALSVGAILLARKRPVLAGALLGIAVAGKMWALLAVGPVLIAAPGRRPQLLAAAAAGGAAMFAPFVLGDPVHMFHLTTVSTSAAGLWTPFHLFWPLADIQTVVRPDGTAINRIQPPALLAAAAHPLIVVAGAALSAAAYRRGRRGVPDALALFALCLLVRCLLDPWNIAYYALPVVVALAAWDLLRRPGPPVLALIVLGLTWVSFWRVSQIGQREVMWAFYSAWTGGMIYALTRAAVLGLPLVPKLLQREPVPLDAPA